MMQLPEPDRRQLTKSPLQIVVCQIRHERVQGVGEGPKGAELFEALGGADGPYPLMEGIEQRSVNVALGPGAPQIEETKLGGWRLASEDGGWVAALHADHFSLETTCYTTWEADFRGRLESLIDVVAEHVRPNLVQRIGLRYIDHITEPEADTIQDLTGFITPQVFGMGLHETLGSAVVATQSQASLVLDRHTKCTMRHGFHPDGERDGKLTVVLDFDIHRDATTRFDPSSLKASIATLEDTGLRLFQASVKPELLDQLR